jgi:hypothetical protein
MSLTAYHMPTPVRSTSQITSPALLSFQDDGYYWFLEPVFRSIAEQTGQYIDLYSNADFYEGGLLALQDGLEVAHQMVNDQAARWDVIIGTYADSGESIYCPVKKQDFLELLQRFEDAVLKAILHRQHLVFFGD